VVLDRAITTANRITVAGAGGQTIAPPAQTAAGSYVLQLDPRSQRLTSRVLHSRFTRSAVRLSGAVLNAFGAPAANVPVTVQATPSAGGAAVTVAQTTSDGTGRFQITIPRGDSRKLELAAGSGTVTWQQIVAPSISLRVRALHGARLLFTGRVGIDWGTGPRPTVEIEDRTPVGWQPVAFVTVNRHGAFRKLYPSSPVTIGYRYRFRAAVAAAAGWSAGASAIKPARIKP
jgi:hypothetical protein